MHSMQALLAAVAPSVLTGFQKEKQKILAGTTRSLPIEAKVKRVVN
jgi:hypothetical protein